MQSLQSRPLEDPASQTEQVDNVGMDAEDQGGVVNGEPQLPDREEASEVCGQVEYHEGFCLDRFPMSYNSEVLYPATH